MPRCLTTSSLISSDENPARHTHHRDPVDRLLVAQAQLEDLPILTADPLIGTYDVTIIAA
jgi:PIN domain nuclease of toxin-antitoxin system